MTIEVEPWGGIAVSWQGGRLVLLVDVLDAWAAWDGLLVWKVAIGRA